MNTLKKFTHLLILLGIGLPLLNGCNQFLDENPDNRVELDTPEKCAQLLTNAYTNAGYNFTEWMSDNVTYTVGTTKLPEHNQMYAWEDVNGINQDTPTNFWTSTYDAIAHANEVLAVIDKLSGDQALKDAVKGEAYLTRAYGHFMLVNLFAEHYSSRASARPGVPYVEEPETEFVKQYQRQTIEEVYDKIEGDLLNGLELVDGRFYANSGKYHFTRNAALAFASRFFLFKGDTDKCIEYSSLMLGDDPSVFIKDLFTILEQYSGESQDFLALYGASSDPSNLLLIRNITNFHVNVGYWPDANLLFGVFNDNPWSADDARTSLRYPIFVRGENLALGKYQFLFERSSLTSNVGLNYTIFPAFRGEEVLLNRAEAYAQENDLNAAIDDIQVIVDKRYDNAPTVTIADIRRHYGGSNQEAVMQFIIDEKRKEFYHEGLRWFDIKRFEIEVQHVLADGSDIELDDDDERKVLQIPQAAIDVGGLEPNPR